MTLEDTAQQACDEIISDIKAIPEASPEEVANIYECIRFSRNFVMKRFGTAGIGLMFQKIKQAGYQYAYISTLKAAQIKQLIV